MDRQTVRKINERRKDDETMQLPLNIVRIIDSAQKLFGLDDAQRSDLQPEDVIPKVQSFLNRMVVVRGDDPISKEADYNSTILFKAQLRSRLAFKRVGGAYAAQPNRVRPHHGRAGEPVVSRHGQPRRDGGRSGCAVHRRAGNADDAQHVPFCRCLVQERHPWCAAASRRS